MVFKIYEDPVELLPTSCFYQIPKRVLDTIPMKFPNTDNTTINMVIDNLWFYFSVCKAFPNMTIPMPSVVVDEVWHAFILHTRQYADFCETYFHRFLHHIPKEEQTARQYPENEPTDLLHLWTLSCIKETLDPFNSHSRPSLFYIDVIFRVKKKIPDFAKILREATGLTSTMTEKKSYCEKKLSCTN